MVGLPKNSKSGTHCWEWEGSTQFAQQFFYCCDSATVCRLCRLESTLELGSTVPCHLIFSNIYIRELGKIISNCVHGVKYAVVG